MNKVITDKFFELIQYLSDLDIELDKRSDNKKYDKLRKEMHKLKIEIDNEIIRDESFHFKDDIFKPMVQYVNKRWYNFSKEYFKLRMKEAKSDLEKDAFNARLKELEIMKDENDNTLE